MINNSKKFIKKNLKYIYNSLPDSIKYGKVFRKNYKYLEKSQYFCKEKLENKQLYELINIIQHAYETVPYYNKLFNKLGVTPNEIVCFEDIKNIPFLTKDIVQKNIDSLISSNYKKEKLRYITTGGSTGTPMGLYVDKNYDKAREWAFITHMWSRIGYNINKVHRTIYIRGNKPNSGDYEYEKNSLILSSYNLTKSNMENYIKLINSYNPDFIQAYPSSIAILSDYINENNIKMSLPNLKGIICASENLYVFQRKSIEKAFGIRVFSFYGHTEHACIGGECEYSNYYHLQSEYGYTEILDEYGNEVTKENGIGEIVVTGFNNYAMPFIRYRTGDMAVVTNSKCQCGRSYKLIKKIEGRIQEQIITNTGAKVAMTGLIFAQHFNAFGKMKNIQLVQNEVGKVTVRIEEKEKMNQSDIVEVINKMEEACNNNIRVMVEIVDEIPRTMRGKHKFLIQNIK